MNNESWSKLMRIKFIHVDTNFFGSTGAKCTVGRLSMIWYIFRFKDSHIKIRLSDRLIFIMGNPISGKTVVVLGRTLWMNTGLNFFATLNISCQFYHFIVAQWCQMLTHIWVNTGSDSGLLPHGTKPLPDDAGRPLHVRNAPTWWFYAKRYLAVSHNTNQNLKYDGISDKTA